jgi:drug/metabolite transporter (DMT)-like permease
LDNIPRGTAFFLLSLVFFVSLDSLAKHLTQTYSPVEVAWGRYVFAMALLPVFLSPRRMLRAARTARPWLQLLRSFLLAVTTCLFFLTVKYIPLADAVAIGFIAPLLTTALAIPLLGEKVGARRWTAIVIGLVGALIIMRPGFETRHWAYFLPIATAIFMAFFTILTRMLARHDSSDTTMFYTALVGGIVLSLAVPFFWQPPAALDWLLLAAAGAFGSAGHFSLIIAYRYAPVSLLAPFTFLHMVLAVIFGLAFFGNFPDGLTLAGAAVIAAAGIYVFRRETQLRRAAARAGPGV